MIWLVASLIKPFAICPGGIQSEITSVSWLDSSSFPKSFPTKCSGWNQEVWTVLFSFLWFCVLQSSWQFKRADSACIPCPRSVELTTFLFRRNSIKWSQSKSVQVAWNTLYNVYPISWFKTFQKIWCFQWVFHDWALRESEGLLSVPNYGIVSSRQAAGDILRRKRVFFRAWQWALGGREEGGPGIQSRLSQTSSYLSLVPF